MAVALTELRLLIVEDEMMVAMMLEDMLADLGCVVVDVAATLPRGLALASNASVAFNGAILDVNLGGDKVYPVAEALAARSIPFFFATGYGLAGIAESFSRVPALSKPYNVGDLERMLTVVFSRSAEAGG